MSLSVLAKANVRKEAIVVLNDAMSEHGSWLDDVMIKARMVGAHHTTTDDWIPVDEVDMINVSGDIDSQSSHHHLSSPSQPHGGGAGQTPSVVKAEHKGDGDSDSGHAPDEFEPLTSRFEAGPSTESGAQSRIEKLEAMVLQLVGTINQLSTSAPEHRQRGPINTENRVDGLRERWVATKMMDDARRVQKVWMHRTSRKQESPAQAEARMVLYSMLTRSLVKYPSFYRRECVGDNFKIIMNVLMYGTPNSRNMLLSLNKQLADHSKTKDKPYPQFELELRRLFEKLEGLKRPVRDEDKIIYLVQGMKGDGRYNRSVQDINARQLEYDQAHQLLMLNAQRIGDMHAKAKSNTKPTPETNNTEDSGKQGRPNTNANKRGKGNKGGKDGANANKRGKGNKQKKDGGGGADNKKQRAPCTLYLMGNCARENCRYEHMSFEELGKVLNKNTSSSSSSDDGKHAKKNDTKADKPRCLQHKNTGSCQYGDNCKYSHSEVSSTHMVEEMDYTVDVKCQQSDSTDSVVQIEDTPRLATGKQVVIVNVPEGSDLLGLQARIIGHKDQRVLLHLIAEDVADYLRKMMREYGVAIDQARLLEDIGEISYCDEMIEQYEGRAVFDPAASKTLVPHRKHLVKGSVRKLDTPLWMQNYTKDGRMRQITHVGKLALKSNTGCDGHILIDAYIDSASRRILISQWELDDQGWYTEYGGRAVRIHAQDSQENFLALPRWQESNRGIPKTDAGDVKEGEINLDLKGQSGAFYPIPDSCIVTDIELADIDTVQPVGGAMIEINHVHETNIAERYTESSTSELLHNQLGHPNSVRLACMMHWDGIGPRPTGRENCLCAVCSLAKCHHRKARKFSYQFAARVILEHVWMDNKTNLGTSLEGYKNALVVYEGKSAKVFTFFLRSLAEAGDYALLWMRQAHNIHFPRKIIHLHIDGGEIFTKDVQAFCKEHGMVLHISQRAASEHNTKAERPIRTVTEMMRAICLKGGAHLTAYWPVGFKCAEHALGLMPPQKLLRQNVRGVRQAERPLTPNEIWDDVKYPDYKSQFRNLVTPFCEVIAIYDDAAKRGSKQNAPGFPGIYLGPVHDNDFVTRAHLVLDYADGVRKKARQVVAHEDVFPLREGPSKGFTMHPSIWEKNKTVVMNDKADEIRALRMLSAQQNAWDPEMTTSVTWEAKDDYDLYVPAAPSAPLPKEFKGGDVDSEELLLYNDTSSDEDDETEAPSLVPPDGPTDTDGPTDADSHTDSTRDEHDTMPSLEQDIELYKEQDVELYQDVEEMEEKARAHAVDDSTSGNRHSARSTRANRTGKVSKEAVHRKAVNGLDRLARNDLRAQRATRRSRRFDTDDSEIKTNRERFAPGTEVQTKWGTAIVQHLYSDDQEMALSWPDGDQPDAQYTVDADSVWLQEDHPEEIYNFQGEKVKSLETCLAELLPDDAAHRNSHVEEACNAEVDDTTTFRGVLIDDLIGNIKAADINNALPRHRHQIQHHVLRPVCEGGEVDELTGLILRGTFSDPMDLPEGGIAIPLMWVYLAKANDDGSGLFARMRARLTVMGNRQKREVTKYEAYSPVAHPISFKILLIIHMGDPSVKIKVFDVGQAFLSSEQTRAVYVRHPPGYRLVAGSQSLYFLKLAPGEKPPRTVMKLLLALYGGVECSRLYWEAFVSWHISYDFQTSHYDKCYLYKTRGPSFIKISFHVDDGMIAYKGEELWLEYVQTIKQRFDIDFSDLEGKKKFLGSNFHLDRSAGICLIDQEQLIDKMLADFGMTHCNEDVASPFVWPLPTDADLPEVMTDEMKSFDMYKALGYLNYLQGGVHPEISCPLKRLSRFAVHYGEKHIKLAKHLMRWCKRTKHTPLVLRYSEKPRIQIFTDASHASCPDTRRSITGVVIKVGGSTVLWKCMNQSMVSHSSTESELIALDKGATIGVYARHVLDCMLGKRHGTIELFVDNQSAISIAANPVHPDRNLHIHARYFYIRDLVEGKHYVIKHAPSADQLADILCTFKSQPNFVRLYLLLMGVATYERVYDNHYEWRLNNGRWNSLPKGGDEDEQ